ncbi:MAG: hypothetical protein A2161_14600 [Candidatus Schekmanbacteria bacterium RBG_13_48_7]|uniref:Glycosyltransferase 2-like domain-containing protein n=1 Tax=Candidatus Schekmanbacteria bacterium RBG_13_48_7 TaxID=1817878 RepID=A0A1F7RR98_9BACT|nr:MAG: hypothetical protein A2161_14600 [Candidatus Schekmanbacteria bacterium RBG_13_48_7]
MNEARATGRNILSVIIISWNIREYLKSCLESVLHEEPGFSIEIIIVDNASEDGTTGWLEQNYPSVKLIKNPINEGFAKACNQGFRISSGEYLLFLNPDTVILDDCLNRTVSFIKSHSDCAVVGCRLLNNDHSIQPSIRKFMTNKNLILEHLSRMFSISSSIRKKFDYKVFSYADVQVVDWIIGAFMLFKREDFEGLRGFDEDFHLYHEDTDICYRVHKTGKKVYFFPDASIIHFGNQSGKKRFGDQTILKYYEAKHLFLKKHFSGWVLLVYRFLMTCLLTSRLVYSLIFDLQQKYTDRNFLFKGIKIQIGGSV